MYWTKPLAIAGGLLVAVQLPAQHENHGPHNESTAALGRVSFDNSGSSAAQRPFHAGLALLHSFEYEQAADSFRAAQKAAPRFALAYWMEALTNSQLVWGLEDKTAALRALARLAPTPQARLALARTPSERGFGKAVEGLYGDGDTRTRARRFSAAAQEWARSTPADLESHAFAALGSIWDAFFARGPEADSINRAAVQHAQYVFDRNSQHPGAAHYIIHASDNPAGAERGLKAAREYSRIAPDAGHALHMPSHIFLQLGLWDDMVDSNERSWKAVRAYVASHNKPLWENDWHSLNWLQYAYLQQGRWKDARALIDTARALTAGASGKITAAENPDAMFVVEQLAFNYGAETGDWSLFPQDSASISLADSTLSDRARGMATGSLYQRGTVAALRGDTIAAFAAAKALQSMRPPYALMIAAAMLERTNNRAHMIAALEKLRPQVKVNRYVSLTPSRTVNVDEMLGAALVASGRPREAIEIYQEALKDRPRRAASLLGLARAQAAEGDSTGAAKTFSELREMWKRADPEVRAKAQAPVPLLSGVDHFFATSSNPEPLYRFFRDTLGLPEVYPFRNYGDFTSGVMSAGNTLIEIVRWEVPKGKTLATELRGIAFAPGGTTQSTLDRLDAKKAVRQKPDSVRMQNSAGERVLAYVNIGLDDAGGLTPDSASIFINDNLGSARAVGRRKAGADSLAARNGGAIGVIAVKELVLGVADVDKALAAWRKVLDSPSQESKGLITFPDGPALRLVKAPAEGILEMVIQVKSVAAASRTLAALGIAGTVKNGQLEVSLRGIPARLVE